MTQPVIASTIGRPLDRQRRRGCHRPGRIDVALPRQDVEHDVAAAQPGRQRLAAGRLDRIEPGLCNRRQDVDELAIAIVMPGKPATDSAPRSQLRNGSPFLSAPGLRASTGKLMPGIVRGLALA
jgi:hypothetical protein